MKRATILLCALSLLSLAWWAQARTVMVVTGGTPAAAASCPSGTMAAGANESFECGTDGSFDRYANGTTAWTLTDDSPGYINTSAAVTVGCGTRSLHIARDSDYTGTHTLTADLGAGITTSFILRFVIRGDAYPASYLYNNLITFATSAYGSDNYLVNLAKGGANNYFRYGYADTPIANNYVYPTEGSDQFYRVEMIVVRDTAESNFAKLYFKVYHITGATAVLNGSSQEMSTENVSWYAARYLNFITSFDSASTFNQYIDDVRIVVDTIAAGTAITAGSASWLGDQSCS